MKGFTKRNLWSCDDCGQLINERWLETHKCPKKGEQRKMSKPEVTEIIQDKGLVYTHFKCGCIVVDNRKGQEELEENCDNHIIEELLEYI